MRKYVPLDVSVLPPSSQRECMDMWCVYVLEIWKISQVDLCMSFCICLCFGASKSQLSPRVCVCVSAFAPGSSICEPRALLALGEASSNPMES